MTPFNWTAEALQAQYETAKPRGWLRFFVSAAGKFDFKPEQLMAVASRESGPFWAAHPTGDVVGDQGSAFGIFQIHIKFHPDRENYTTVEANIFRGAKILADYRAQIEKKLADYPDPVDPKIAEVMVYASYNRGVNGMWTTSWLQARSPDACTAHGNYAHDCQYPQGRNAVEDSRRSLRELTHGVAQESPGKGSKQEKVQILCQEY